MWESEWGKAFIKSEVWNWRGPVEVVWSIPSAQEGPPKATCPHLCLDVLLIPARRRFCNFPGEIVSGLSHLWSQSGSWFSECCTDPPVSQVVPFVSHRATGHHSKESGSILFAAFLQYLHESVKSPLSLLLRLPQLSQPFLVGFLSEEIF